MIDLCKIFGVEEGEEFKLGNGFYNDLVYKVSNNILWSRCLDNKAFTRSTLYINELLNVKEIIKLPKKKEFTDDELAVFKCMDKKYKWATRDRRYGLTVFENKPEKITNNSEEYWKTSGDWLYLGCFENMFKTITTEDEEPVFIDDYVERGVENDRYK